MGIVGFGSFLAKHNLYHTGLLHAIPWKAKEITGLPQARCGIDGDAVSMKVRVQTAKNCPQWDAVWLSRVIAETLRRHAGVFRDAGFDFVKAVLAGIRPLHKHEWPEELALEDEAMLGELEGGAGGAAAGLGGQASDCMQHQPAAGSEPAAAGQQSGGSQAQETDPLRGPVSRAAFRLLREWKGQRADMDRVDVMIADYETKSHLGMGGEVLYSKEHDVLIMGTPMQITAIWRWSEDDVTGAEGRRARNETGAAAQDTCNISGQRFQAGDWVAQYVTLEDVLRATGLPLPLFAVTVAVTCRTDYGPGIGGFDLDSACRAVRESGLVGQAMDTTTLEKVYDVFQGAKFGQARYQGTQRGRISSQAHATL